MAGVKAGPVVEANVDPVTADVAVGGYVCAADPVAFNDHRPVTRLTVRNTGDRPVQIGSHFHFFEVNRALEFDRPAAFGQHLNIPASTALRFEPGDEREVEAGALWRQAGGLWLQQPCRRANGGRVRRVEEGIGSQCGDTAGVPVGPVRRSQ